MKQSLLILSLASLMVLTSACAKQKARAVPPRATAPVDRMEPEPSDGGPAREMPSKYASIPLKIESAAALEQYAGRSVVNPKDIKLQISLTEIDKDRFGGYVSIGYEENGKRVNSLQVSWNPYQAMGNAESVKHNIWRKKDGIWHWHGFFQDYYGGIVIVFEKEYLTGLGDGVGSMILHGSVWFKNFQSTYPFPKNTQSPTAACWEIRVGPYDCRTFLVNDDPNGDYDHESRRWNIDTRSSIEPNNGFFGNQRANYIRLGTFTGLNYAKTFGKD